MDGAIRIADCAMLPSFIHQICDCVDIGGGFGLGSAPVLFAPVVGPEEVDPGDEPTNLLTALPTTTHPTTSPTKRPTKRQKKNQKRVNNKFKRENKMCAV